MNGAKMPYNYFTEAHEDGPISHFDPPFYSINVECCAGNPTFQTSSNLSVSSVKNRELTVMQIEKKLKELQANCSQKE